MSKNITEKELQRQPQSGKQRFLILSVLLLMTTSVASGYGGAIVLPQKLMELNAMDYYSVCSAASSMGMMMALPLVGVLGSKFGIKTITLLFGIIGQFLARLLLMFTGNIIVFIILWTIAGIAAGFYISAPYTIMADIVSEQERPKYYGILATFSAIGALIGPILTGAMVDTLSTNIALIAYIIFAILPIIGLTLLYPNQKRPTNGNFDFMGIICLVVSICCIVMYLSLGGKSFGFTSLTAIILIVVGIISAVILVKVEGKHKNPSVPLHMFKKSRFRTTFVVQMLLVAYSTCVAAYGIVYVQQVMQQSASISSTVTMPQTIVQAVLGLFIGSFIGKNFKKRFRTFSLLALVSYTAGLVIFSMLTPNSSMLIIYIATAMGGIGQAITQSAYAPFFQTQLKPEEYSAAQGMYQFGATGGSCIFIAVCGATLNMGFTLNQVFILGTAVLIVALIIGIVGFKFTKEEIEAKTE